MCQQQVNSGETSTLPSTQDITDCIYKCFLLGVFDVFPYIVAIIICALGKIHGDVMVIGWVLFVMEISKVLVALAA